jgi:hypothetical protein
VAAEILRLISGYVRGSSERTSHPDRFQIQDPLGNYQIHERGVSNGDHSFVAHADGKYIYCFNNEHWGSTNTKEVSFNVHGIVYVPESEAPQDPLEKEGKALLIEVRDCSNSRTVRTLSELVAQVKDEQGYIVVRERTHRNTAESTNARVKWWSIFQLLILLGEGIFQVWWIKRFFEVRSHLAASSGTLLMRLSGQESGLSNQGRKFFTGRRYHFVRLGTGSLTYNTPGLPSGHFMRVLAFELRFRG